ncbi:MAG: DUF6273 domain-containing protein [Lachnospiraceae bacterium]
MRGRYFLFVGILIACICGCNGDNVEPTPAPASPTQSIGATDKIALTVTPQPTMTLEEIYLAEKEQREEERKALLVSPTPGPEPYVLLGTDREIKVGDIVTIGEYCHSKNEYSSYDDRFPLKWLVLEQKEEKVLLLTLHCIDILPYMNNTKYQEQKEIGFTWENSTMRACLNQELLYLMFQEEEQLCISETVIHTPNNPVYGTDGGEDTTDCLFLLSIEEVQKYFASDLDRRTQIVPDVELQQWDLQPYQHDLNTTDYYDWWLRSPGENSENAACVGRFGEIMMEGQWIVTEDVSIRPAMWIDLNKVKEVGLEMDVEE